MLIKFYNYNFAGEFLENFSLRLFTPKERYEIWTTIIKKLFDEEEKIKDKKVILNILLLIMYYSEYYGTANVISYSAEKSKQFPLKIKIANKMDSVSVDFDIN